MMVSFCLQGLYLHCFDTKSSRSFQCFTVKTCICRVGIIPYWQRICFVLVGFTRFVKYKWELIFIFIFLSNLGCKKEEVIEGNEDELIETKKQKEIDKLIHNWTDEGIRLEKARWGRFNLIKGKTKIELPKTTNADKMTLENALAIFEKKKPKRKAAAKKKPAAKKK